MSAAPRGFCFLVGMTTRDFAPLLRLLSLASLSGFALRLKPGKSGRILHLLRKVLILSILIKKQKTPLMRGFLLFGRDDRIRTCGLCVPNATLYQAEPHPVTKIYYHIFFHLSTDKRLRFTF